MATRKLEATAVGRRIQKSADLSKGAAGLGAIMSVASGATAGVAAVLPFVAKTPQGAAVAAVVTAASYLFARYSAEATGDLIQRSDDKMARGRAIEALVAKMRGGSPALGMRGVVPDAKPAADGKRPPGMMKLGGPADAAPTSDQAASTLQGIGDMQLSGVLPSPNLGRQPIGRNDTAVGNMLDTINTAHSRVTETRERRARGDMGPLLTGAAISPAEAKVRAEQIEAAKRAPGKAYLNDGAQKKAEAKPKAAPMPAAAGRQAAPAQTSDGQTAGYTRTDPRTGSLVTVKAYKTPKK